MWNFWLYSTRLFSEVQSTTFELARIAVSLDDKDAMAHAVLASQILVRGDFATAIAEARSALTLNPNNAFVMGTYGRTVGFGGFHDEGIDYLRRAMRAGPHDPLTWAWKFWAGIIQFFARDFTGEMESLFDVLRLRPEYSHPHLFIMGAQAFLGRLDDAAQTLERLRTQYPDEMPRFFEARPPWLRPEDYELRMESLRLIGVELA